MILDGVDFGRAWCSSGARNFYGDVPAWPHHRWLGPLAPDFRGSTFVAKTTTLDPRPGNLPLDPYGMPTERLPRCIRVNFRRAAVLNAVGLSGPGLDQLLWFGKWQAIIEPFVLSFMAVGGDRCARLSEAACFASRLAEERRWFVGPFAVQVNLSCPNVGLDPSGLVIEARTILAWIADLIPGVPLIPKLNVLVPPAVAAEIGAHPACSALCVSNTIPWGAMPDRIDWRGLFGLESPLARFGGGGLSGSPLTDPVREWAAEYLGSSHPVPLVAGGGVMRPSDAIALLDLGASAVEIGSVAITRPWRVKRIVAAINSWKPKGTGGKQAVSVERFRGI